MVFTLQHFDQGWKWGTLPVIGETVDRQTRSVAEQAPDGHAIGIELGRTDLPALQIAIGRTGLIGTVNFIYLGQGDVIRAFGFVVINDDVAFIVVTLAD